MRCAKSSTSASNRRLHDRAFDSVKSNTQRARAERSTSSVKACNSRDKNNSNSHRSSRSSRSSRCHNKRAATRKTVTIEHEQLGWPRSGASNEQITAKAHRSLARASERRSCAAADQQAFALHSLGSLTALPISTTNLRRRLGVQSLRVLMRIAKRKGPTCAQFC